jgi:hypothetical protein
MGAEVFWCHASWIGMLGQLHPSAGYIFSKTGNSMIQGASGCSKIINEAKQTRWPNQTVSEWSFPVNLML